MSLIVTPPGSGSPGSMIWEDTQIEWQGLLMGMDTFFGYKSLVGWDDLPNVDTTDTPRPRAHGSFAGAMYADQRVVTFESQVYAFKEYFPQLRREYLLRTQVEQDEQPLVIRQHGEKLQAWARVQGRSWKINRSYFGGYPIATTQWVCSDPRRYSTTENQITLAVPSTTGGLNWTPGLDWGAGLDWGSTVSGTGLIINSGTTETPLRFNFVGPLTPPYFVHAPGNWALGFTLPLLSGETLVADARTGSVTLGAVDRLYTLAPVSDVPEDALGASGDTFVQFITGNSGDTGHVDIFWRDATM